MSTQSLIGDREDYFDVEDIRVRSLKVETGQITLMDSVTGILSQPRLT